MNTEYGTLDMTRSPVGRPAEAELGDASALAGGIALVVMLSFALR